MLIRTTRIASLHIYVARAGALLAALSLALASAASAQTQQPTPAPQSTSPSQQKIPRVSTTVLVHADTSDNYLPDSLTAGTLGAEPLQNAPLSATVVTRQMLSDQQARLLSDVVKNDASVDDDYVPVGYYGVYEIRGFPIDLATGLEINGMTIAGEQDVPLENKQSVEILQGLAGVESGVAAAGGLIDYVTKQPAAVRDLDLGTDHRGTAYGAVDIGHLFGARKQVGLRANLATEHIVSYMNDTNGWRAVGAGAADWRISPNATLTGNFEYQHKVERDGSGYQLLGGTTLPDINSIFRSTMLGDQPWAPPDSYDVFNTGARLDYTLPHNWSAFASASLSHSLIQDNVIYAYGTPMSFDSGDGLYDIPTCPGVANPLAYFFCPAVPGVSPGGGYGIYDYRDPGELRIDGVAEAMLTGHIKTGLISQDITLGAELFLRSVQQPGQPPSGSPDNIQDGAVYAYLGAENIYQPMTPYPIETDSITGTPDQAGPRTLWEDSHQSSAVVQDRIHLPARIQLIAGGRFDSLRDQNYSATATDPSIPPTPSDRSLWLPQYAVTYNPITNLTLYGNYGVLLSLGPQAPWWVDDASQFLDPFFTRQSEIGAKYEPGQRILITTALFHMRAPFFYPKILTAADATCGPGMFDPTSSSNQCFESEGRETHNGVELSAQGKAASWLRLSGSALAMNAVSDNTGTPTFDNKQVINVPHLHTALFADVAVPHLRGLYLMPGWSYTSRKEATRDDLVSVPSYNIFNLGARYTPGGEQGRVTFRLYANNIADKLYWSDTGTSAGDSFVWLGAPTTVRLSAHYTF
jgi:iron complex outermembrane receptor protein